MKKPQHVNKKRSSEKVTVVRIYHRGVSYNGTYSTRYIASINGNTLAFKVQGLSCEITEEIILHELVTKMHKLRPQSKYNPVKEPLGKPDMVIRWAKPIKEEIK